MKASLGFGPDADDEVVREEWDKRAKHVCKPCWELKYCPYGPLVEDFPLVPPTKAQAMEHQEFLKAHLARGAYDEERRSVIEDMVTTFRADDYPDRISPTELNWGCNIFGHVCPVFIVNERVTETHDTRRIGRHIPVTAKMRIARRDNYTCQICGKHLKDSEIEFDHVIPWAKGGSSEEHNIRLTCSRCNRRKSKKLEI